jgi:hypothetical protein
MKEPDHEMYRELLSIVVAGMHEVDDLLDNISDAIDDREADVAQAVIRRTRFWLSGIRNSTEAMQERCEPRLSRFTN